MTSQAQTCPLVKAVCLLRAPLQKGCLTAIPGPELRSTLTGGSRPWEYQVMSRSAGVLHPTSRWGTEPPGGVWGGGRRGHGSSERSRTRIARRVKKCEEDLKVNRSGARALLNPRKSLNSLGRLRRKLLFQLQLPKKTSS